MASPLFIDPRCPWVQVKQGINTKVQRVDYVPADLTGGRLGINVHAIDKAKLPVWGDPFTLLLPDHPERLNLLVQENNKTFQEYLVLKSLTLETFWQTPRSPTGVLSIDNFGIQPDFLVDMAGGLFYPDRGERGPFTIRVGDAQVSGMGLPLNRHVRYVVLFKVINLSRA